MPFVFEGEQLAYAITHKYNPDFILANGVIIETKGHLSDDDRRKMLAVKAAHPGRDIRFVFMRPHNRISSGSNTTYADWCEKHGFPWSGPKVPDDWLT